MTKREFLKRMKRARRQVIYQNGGDDQRSRQGVCRAILQNFKHGIVSPREIFMDNFTPSHEDYNYFEIYWLDSSLHWNRNDNMTELERRLVFLESFKGFCLCYELYKSWD